MWAAMRQTAAATDGKACNHNQTFLNDLEPSPANLAEAASLIRKLMYRPDEAAHSGPVFDFCISWMGSERVAFISQTAIMREGRHIKWYDEE